MNISLNLSNFINFTNSAKEVFLKINPDLILRDIDYCVFNPKTFKMYKFSKDIYKVIKYLSENNISQEQLIHKITVKKQNEEKFCEFFKFAIDNKIIITE